jgi:hypothetical protein
MKCRLCGEDKRTKSRGLCVACHSYCERQVGSGRTTWGQIVAAGYADEAHTPEIKSRLANHLATAGIATRFGAKT